MSTATTVKITSTPTPAAQLTTVPISTSKTQRPSPAEADFARWRPKYHIIAPQGWLNDPCAPGFNPATRQYHVGFQWNPHSHVWNNISWGAATSLNFVDWRISATPSLAPTASQDVSGVFTGCLAPPSQDGTMTTFYTSAQRLPIHHSIDPYPRGCERLHFATSTDGRVWHRPRNNIVLAEPPEGMPVTGWRDPFVGPWPRLDDICGEKDGLYGILSGGLRDRTPTAFCYKIDRQDLRNWTYLGPLFDLAPQPQSNLSDLGINWEVVNFISLGDDEGIAHDFLIASAEGIKDQGTFAPDSVLATTRKNIFMCVSPRQVQSLPLQCGYSGVLDHGSLYAANGFYDPVTKHFVHFGWIPEDDLSDKLVARQKWSGCLSIPRVLTIKTLRNVARAMHSQLSQQTAMDVVQEESGLYTIRMLSIAPDDRLHQLRLAKGKAAKLGETARFSGGRPCSQIELLVSFWVSETCTSAGFDILHGPDASPCYTRVHFLPKSCSVVVDRTSTTPREDINVAPITAPHTLFTTINCPGQQEDVQEPLRVHVFFDTSVLEVFVNERTVVSTRVYAESGTCYGVRPFVTETVAECSSVMLGCELWSLRPSVVQE